jgi:hypothetical protein
MNTSSPDDLRLRGLLRDARTALDLPPGFQNAVWRRIEHVDTQPARSAAWLDEIVAWLLSPRHALVGATGLVLLGITIGVVQGGSLAHDLARDRYVAAVSPLTVH